MLAPLVICVILHLILIFERGYTFSWKLKTGGKTFMDSCLVASWPVLPHLLQLYSFVPNFSGWVYRSRQSASELGPSFFSSIPRTLLTPLDLLRRVGLRSNEMSRIGSNADVTLAQFKQVTSDCKTPANVLWITQLQWCSLVS